LANIVKMGAKLYYMGNRSGLDGWFIVKNGQVQIAYVPAGGQSILIGAMFGADGENITAAQVKILVDTNQDISALLTNAAKEQAEITNTPTPAANAAPKANGSLPSVSLSPGERLIHDLSGAAGVTIGNPSAPQILMVMDPNCPHCQATWKGLRDPVFKNTVQIRMIPIATPGTDNERAAGQLLHVTDPLNAWDKYVAGDKNQLAGTPDASLVAAVHANHELVDSWNIHATPYLVYRSKDGTVKVLQGEPDKVSALLVDLGS
jgi:thiol:disulfide interchange protein DsbG